VRKGRYAIFGAFGTDKISIYEYANQECQDCLSYDHDADKKEIRDTGVINSVTGSIKEKNV
jgi:hypothetical protein